MTGNFRQNFIKLASGNGLAFVITLLSTPVIARLYAPEAFGAAALFASTLAIISVLACMRYEMAIVLPENEKKAINLLGLSLCLTVLTALLSLPLIWVFGETISHTLGAEELALLLWLLPLGILANGAYEALNFWNTRKKHFTLLAVTQVTSQTINTGTVLGGGAAGATSGTTMILAALLAKGVSVVMLGASLIHHSRILLRSITLKEMANVLIRYKKFPLYGSWSILLGVAAWQLPVLLLGVFFSSAVVGFYALGFRILQIPMNLLGSSLGQVFFQRATEAKKRGQLPQLVNNLFDKIVVVGLFPMLMLAFIGRDLYIVVFGENWAQAGIYTQILSLWAFFWFLSGPFTSLFAVLERQELQLKWNIFNFAIRLLSILIGGYFQSAILAIALYAISGALIYAYKVFITLKIADASVKLAMTTLTKHAMIFAPAGLCVFFVSLATTHILAGLAVAFLLCSAYGFYIAEKLFPEYKNILRRNKPSS